MSVGYQPTELDRWLFAHPVPVGVVLGASSGLAVGAATAYAIDGLAWTLVVGGGFGLFMVVVTMAAAASLRREIGRVRAAQPRPPWWGSLFWATFGIQLAQGIDGLINHRRPVVLHFTAAGCALLACYVVRRMASSSASRQPATHGHQI